MSADLSVAVGRSQGLRVLLSVAGEIDHDNVDPLTDTATRLIDQGYRHLVLDLSGVGFCDSSGLNCMIRIFHHAAAVDGSLVLTAIPGRLKRLMAVTGVDQLIPTVPSVDAAFPVPDEPAAP